MTEAAFDPLRVVAALNAQGVRYVVVGDLAAMAHGSARSAKRIEICVGEQDDDIARLGIALQSLGSVPIPGGDEHRVPFDTWAGRVECVELPDDGGYAGVDAHASDVDLGRGVFARVAATQDVAAQQLASDDLVGAVRAAALVVDRSGEPADLDEDEYGPDPATPDGRMGPFRRVWKAFEDIDRFMSDLDEGILPWSRDRRR